MPFWHACISIFYTCMPFMSLFQCKVSISTIIIQKQSIYRNGPINQQGVNGVLPYVGISKKKLCTLVTPLNHKTPNFCLRLTSSMRIDLSNSLTTYAFFILSSTPNALDFSMISKTQSSFKRIFFFLSTLSNTSSFHLKSAFKASNLVG